MSNVVKAFGPKPLFGERRLSTVKNKDKSILQEGPNGLTTEENGRRHVGRRRPINDGRLFIVSKHKYETRDQDDHIKL